METRWALPLLVALSLVVACGERPPSSPSPLADRAATPLSPLDADAQVAINFGRSIAADDEGTLHVVWFEDEGGPGSVWHRRSPDGGQTWEAPRHVADVFQPQGTAVVAAAGAYVYVAWHDFTGGNPDIRLQRSTDRGATWEAPFTLVGGSAPSAFPSLAAFGERVRVVWGDNRDGEHAEIYTSGSCNGGESWSAPQRISSTPYESWVPTVALNDDVTIVAWIDYRDANEELYIRRSLDQGDSWEPVQRLTNDPADSWAPSLALDGETVHIAWFDRRHALSDELDLEATLDEALRLVGLAPGPPAPARDPASYYLPRFQERRDATQARVSEAAPAWVRGGGDPKELEALFRRLEGQARAWEEGWEIYYLRSTDRGASFAPEVRLTDVPGRSLRPSVAASGETVTIAWFDVRDDQSDIFLLRSPDGGNNWDPEERVTRSDAFSMRPSVAITGEAVHLFWREATESGGRATYSSLPR